MMMRKVWRMECKGDEFAILFDSVAERDAAWETLKREDECQFGAAGKAAQAEVASWPEWKRDAAEATRVSRRQEPAEDIPQLARSLSYEALMGCLWPRTGDVLSYNAALARGLVWPSYVWAENCDRMRTPLGDRLYAYLESLVDAMYGETCHLLLRVVKATDTRYVVPVPSLEWLERNGLVRVDGRPPAARLTLAATPLGRAVAAIRERGRR